MGGVGVGGSRRTPRLGMPRPADAGRGGSSTETKGSSGGWRGERGEQRRPRVPGARQDSKGGGRQKGWEVAVTVRNGSDGEGRQRRSDAV